MDELSDLLTVQSFFLSMSVHTSDMNCHFCLTLQTVTTLPILILCLYILCHNKNIIKLQYLNLLQSPVGLHRPDNSAWWTLLICSSGFFVPTLGWWWLWRRRLQEQDGLVLWWASRFRASRLLRSCRWIVASAKSPEHILCVVQDMSEILQKQRGLNLPVRRILCGHWTEKSQSGGQSGVKRSTYTEFHALCSVQLCTAN